MISSTEKENIMTKKMRDIINIVSEDVSIKNIETGCSVITEHSMVIFIKSYGHVPKGARGTVVGIYDNGKSYSVEIISPFHDVIEVEQHYLREE